MPVAIRVCADASKGQGVFATAPVTKGTLLWRPKEVKAVPADKMTSILAAMPHDKASVRAQMWFISSKHSLALNSVFYFCRSFFDSPLLLLATQELSA